MAARLSGRRPRRSNIACMASRQPPPSGPKRASVGAASLPATPPTRSSGPPVSPQLLVPRWSAQYHLPLANPPKATRPITAITMPSHKLHRIATIIPTITSTPPSPMPPNARFEAAISYLLRGPTRGSTCQWTRLDLASRSLAALAAGRLFLGGRSSLGGRRTRTGVLAAPFGRSGRVGDSGSALLRHSLVLQCLVLLFVLDV